MIGGVANCYVPNAKLLYCCLIFSATLFASIHIPSVILEQQLGSGG